MKIRLLLVFLMLGCFGCSDSANPADAGNDPDAADAGTDMGASALTWTQLAPKGGFVSALAFDPSGTPWLSGDDGSGLYKPSSTGWVPMNAPVNWSTYSWAFDPNYSARVYAPSHFGRGFAVSANRGESWDVLPQPALGRVHDLVAVDNAGKTRLLAVSTKIWLSDDQGVTFRAVSSVNVPDATMEAIHFDANSQRLYVGNEKGGVFISDDFGETWEVFIPTSDAGIPVTDIKTTPNSLYLGFALGLVARSRTFTIEGVEILDTQTTFGSFLWTTIDVVPGVDASTDTLYVGTIGPGRGAFGLFKSVNGGDTFTVSALPAETAVFDFAVNPTNPAHLIVGSVNGPVFESTDSAATWQDKSEGVVALDSLAIGQNPDDPDHLMFSSLAAIPGNGKLFESHNHGASWQEIDSPVETYAIQIIGEDLLVGDFYDGIHRRRNGVWTKVLTGSEGIREIAQDPNHATRLLAATSERAAALGVYESTDAGESWSLLPVVAGLGVEFLPNGNALLMGTDVTFLSTENAATSSGLGMMLAGKAAADVTYDPDDAGLLFASANTGEAYVAQDCTIETAPCTWRELESPLSNVMFSQVTITDGIWYLGGASVDAQSAPSRSGLWWSSDQGETWHEVDAYPCNLVWRLQRSALAGEVLVGLWGGGFGALRPTSN